MAFATGSLGVKTNRETWSQAFEVVDENDDPVTITDAEIDIAVRKTGSSSPNLTATVGDGITISTPNFTFTFSETDMNRLDPGAYDVGIRITLSGSTTQLFKGTVNIEDGIID